MIDTNLTGVGFGALALMLAGWLWHSTARWREAHDERYEKLIISATDSAAGVRILTDLYKDSRERHEKLLVSTTDIGRQVTYLTGMIQSEKGTLQRTTAGFTEQLKELRDEMRGEMRDIRDRLPERRE